jgi:hypothetical protein
LCREGSARWIIYVKLKRNRELNITYFTQNLKTLHLWVIPFIKSLNSSPTCHNNLPFVRKTFNTRRRLNHSSNYYWLWHHCWIIRGVWGSSPLELRTTIYVSKWVEHHIFTQKLKTLLCLCMGLHTHKVLNSTVSINVSINSPHTRHNNDNYLSLVQVVWNIKNNFLLPQISYKKINYSNELFA